ncbi:hypothetical protein ACQ4LE_010120 [Meloidogyne hapla]
MSSLINSTKLISPTFISPEIIIFGYFMGIVELVIHPIIFCFSFINISILITTNILHPNLWLLLVFQSTIISTFEIQRFTMVLLKFTGGDIFRPGDQILQDISLFTNTARNIIGHILLIERMLANFMTRKYENWRRPYFSCISLLFLFLFSSFNVLTNGKSWNTTLINIVSNSIFLGCSSFEFLIIGSIGVKNIKKYKKLLPNTIDYSLSEKYQITENIRTSRQLAPVFICHLLNNFCYAILTYLVYFNIITQPPYKLSLCYAVLFVFTSIIEGIIEITVLTHHPALRKTLLSRIKRLFSFKLASIRPISSTNSNINFKKEIFNSIKNIQGEQLISKTNIDEHFKMLLESWN